MNLRSGKARAGAVAAVGAVLSLTLTGCQTHAGAAAVVDGKTISEKTVGSYVKPTMKNLTYTSGQSVSPRTFVLQALLQEHVLAAILASTGSAATDSELGAAKSTALQGVGGSEDAFLKQVTDAGLPAKIEPHLLRTQELAVLLTKRVTSEQAQQDLVSKYGGKVSVSPRYGQWNANTLGLTEFGKKQASPAVRYTTPLPGDVTPAAAP